MNSTNTIILGGGQAGLALSHCLTNLGRDHIVIERGRVAERWYSERWDSLRLLTPNWMTRLPGFRYEGPDPDGFMTASEVVAFFNRYATSFDAPVHDHTTIQNVTTDGDRFAVRTDNGTFRADNVVIATGWCDSPAIPAAAERLSSRIHQLVPRDYRNPGELPDGGVLVVGASATGVQLADELRTSGREVTLAVGNHSRLPRQYRGMDVFWWLDLIGAFDKTIDEVSDAAAARREPSIQLVGRADNRTLDLPALHANGVRLVGRLTGIDGTRVALASNLTATVDAAHRQMTNLLARIDEAIIQRGLTTEVLDPEPIPRLAPFPVQDSLDLTTLGINTIIWATGHRRPYEWLDLPIRDRHGEVIQRRGVTPIRGAYVLGQRFQHHRNSNFIDGVGRDARYVAEHICRTRQSTHGLTNSQTIQK